MNILRKLLFLAAICLPMMGGELRAADVADNPLGLVPGFAKIDLGDGPAATPMTYDAAMNKLTISALPGAYYDSGGINVGYIYAEFPYYMTSAEMLIEATVDEFGVMTGGSMTTSQTYVFVTSLTVFPVRLPSPS